MKQNTLQHNYAITLIQHFLVEMQWIKLKLAKTLRVLKTKNHNYSLEVDYTDISYKQEYLLTTIQERIIR